MKQSFFSKTICLTLAVILLTAFLSSCAVPLSVENFGEAQIQGLQKLCKVWGFVKYHHPAVVNGGEGEWDKSLLAAIPKVLEARDGDEVNAILSGQITALGEIADAVRPSGHTKRDDETRLILQNIDWVSDVNYLGKELSGQLEKIHQASPVDRNMPFGKMEMNMRAPFYWETRYKNMNYADAKFQLLGLFRYWAAFAYFSPYTDILDEGWDDVLAGLIPQMLTAKGKQGYLLCLSELAAATKDGHAWVHSEHLTQELGTKLPPVMFKQAEEKIVISSVSPDYAATCPLKRGDVVLALDGVAITEVIKGLTKYVAVPSLSKVERQLQTHLFRTKNPTMLFRVSRQGETLDLEVPCLAGTRYYPRPEISHAWINDGIGLINPGCLAAGELTGILEKFNTAKGLIVDLRQYPSSLLVPDMASFLPDTVVFTLLAMPDYEKPGEFLLQRYQYEKPDKYRFLPYQEAIPDFTERTPAPTNSASQKLVLLTDQNSISQSEFITMLLRTSPLAVVIGEVTLGADGDTVGIPLPGNVLASFSGVGVFTPTGNQTQRLGISPDIHVSPTIQGIFEGRDEIMEEAVAYILD